MFGTVAFSGGRDADVALLAGLLDRLLVVSG
jgi:hypothetical protein